MYGFRKSAFYKVIKKNTTKTGRPYMTYNNMAQKNTRLACGVIKIYTSFVTNFGTYFFGLGKILRFKCILSDGKLNLFFFS
jgi:hypothetical protein